MFLTILGSSLLIIAMLLLLPFMVTMDNKFPYWLINVIILFFLILINYNAFRMWRLKDDPKETEKTNNNDVEFEIKDSAEE
ncbi:MAG: hypothetical protein J5605_05725 [Bacteroidales bacterium]|nr:hypothetical protein [Bacteroidales bacterium]